MRQQLHDLQARNQADSLLTDDTLALSLVSWFDDHGTANERMLAHYLLARTYTDRGEAPQALDEYHAAASIADTTARDCDYRLLAKIHGQTACLFYEQLLPNEMLFELRLYQKFALLAKDTLLAINAYESQAHAYDYKEMPDSVISICHRASIAYLRLGERERAIKAQSGSIVCLLNKGETKEADKYISDYSTLPDFKDENEEIAPSHKMFYYWKGLLYLSSQQTDSAEIMFRHLLRLPTDESMEEAGSRGLLLVYKKKSNADSIAKYAEHCYLLNDSAYQSNNMEQLRHLHALYNYDISQRSAMQSAADAKQKKHLVYFLVIVLLFAVSIGVHIVLGVLRKLKGKETEIQLLERQHAVNIEQMKLAQNDLLKLTGEHYEELITQKIGVIHDLQSKLEKYNNMREHSAPATLNERLHASSIYKTFYNLATVPSRNPTEEEWQELRNLINAEIPRFFSLLNSGTKHLHQHEYDLCILIRLGFKPKDFYVLMGITATYSGNIRRKLFQQIFGQKGATSDFDNWILNIS